ncbi:ferrous iron transport protein A [Natranaerovirga hydrolytica]|uniref:Ferrous iron transport protein A n=1 Tax=Natranaerovirga hydrolytica TaxID=680378 RepID=A0A4V2Q0C3_9FIRM|nr:FeoA family protein [Natranaerovirga hydrolytica]TCK93251.1 ferrous iron transport protein A [Natranaerovirga hydrolytica]
MPLYTFNKKQSCIVEKMPQNDLLQAIGIREGVTLSILSRQPFGGPIVIKLNNRSVAIDKNVAQEITARLVS